MNKKLYEKPATVRHEAKNVVQGSLYTVTLYKGGGGGYYSHYRSGLYYYH